MTDEQRDPEVFYLLVCRECGDPDRPLPIPFGSAAERGRWAAEHTRATGHDRWIVKDEPRSGTWAQDVSDGTPTVVHGPVIEVERPD